MYDSVVMIDQTDWKNIDFYVGKNARPLPLYGRRDLIPYYPYIVGQSGFNRRRKRKYVKLSSESYVDKDERDVLKIYLKHTLRLYNRYKRNQMPLDKDKMITELSVNDKVIPELVERVCLYGKRATIDGLHTTIHEQFREQLVREMVRNGLNPADYGYERFISLSDNSNVEPNVNLE